MKRILWALMSILAIAWPAFSKAQEGSESRSVIAHKAILRLPGTRPLLGDLDGMLKRRTVRILVPYGKTLFFVDRGRQMGAIADLGSAFEDWLNIRHKMRTERIEVVFVPVSRDRLFPELVAGKGDIAAGDLTVTPERKSIVDFANPWLKDVKELVVTGPAGPKLDHLEDLSGKSVYVRRSSSYWTHLEALGQRLAKKGLAPLTLTAADENLEDEDLLEMVNAGLLPLAVVDDHKAKVWAKIFDKLTVRDDLVVNSGGDIAWAIRKGSPQLLDEINSFVKDHAAGTTFGNIIKRRYFGETKIIKNAYSPDDQKKFHDMFEIFRRYGAQYSFDYLMIAAQGYQESQLDQSHRSSAGAVGIMQIKPSTAAGKPILITGVDSDAERNIHAGVAYLRYLVDTYISDPAIDDKNRTLMAFAAYNAGPGNLAKFRQIAKQEGEDPNVWFYNVENGAARVVGRQTVQYVGNIYKYYIAYRLLAEREAAEAAARDKIDQSGENPKP